MPKGIPGSRPTCRIDGCSKHEARFRRNGDPNIAQRHWAPPQPCVICGSEERSIKSRRFCSPKCEAVFYRHGCKPPESKPCAACGVEMDMTTLTRTGQRRRSTRKLCTACARRNRDSMTPAELAERDGVACGICGLDVDLSLTRAGSFRGCASVDHIVPRSLGGDDSPSNLQLAHLGCNMDKSNRVEAA